MLHRYEIPKESLLEIYRDHKTGFDNTLRNVARSVLRDVASKHSARDFFNDRANIEEEMRGTVEFEGEARGIKITGFQVRNVVLPGAAN